MIEALATRAKKEGDVDRVYREIKASILRGQAPPGQFMTEAELARRCGTSRTPVREACNRLAQESWLSHIRHKGYWVSPVSARQIVDAYEYRGLLETFAAERAAQGATAEQLSGLRRIVERERKTSPHDALPTNQQVHLGIAEIAGNRRIVDQLRVTLEFVERLDMLYLEQAKTYVGHEEIVRALEERDPAAARRAMTAHIEDARDRMLKLFGS